MEYGDDGFDGDSFDSDGFDENGFDEDGYDPEGLSSYRDEFEFPLARAEPSQTTKCSGSSYPEGGDEA